MSKVRPFCFAALCVAAFLPGCVTTHDTGGNFTTGGTGKYGESLAAGTSTVERGPFDIFFGPDKESKKPISPQTFLAHAQFEEAAGNAAGARRAFDEQRASYAAARASYEKVLAADEKSVDAVIGLARLDEVAGRVADAEQGFLKAVRLDSNSPRTLDALGQFYTSQKRWSDATETLYRALTAAPDDNAIRFHYGIALARSGQIEMAKPLLVDAVGVATAHYNLGVILHENGDIAGSEEQFSAALLANPRLEQAQQWLKEVRRELGEKPRLAQAASVPAAG